MLAARELIRQGHSPSEAARQTGISPSAISRDEWFRNRKADPEAKQLIDFRLAFEGVDQEFIRPGFVLGKIQEVDALHLINGQLAANLAELVTLLDSIESATHRARLLVNTASCKAMKKKGPAS
jgi:hypothetical protein